MRHDELLPHRRDKIGITRPFALIWNGKVISAAANPPVPAGAVTTSIAGVTCVAVKSCVAAGAAMANSGATRLIFDTWNGSKWTLHTAATGLSSAMTVQANDASCVSLSHCVLVGEYFTSTGASRPLIAAWNGKTSATMKVPVPAGIKSPELLGVSCVSSTSCAATGDDFTISSNSLKATGFTETLAGKTWTAAKLAWPKGTAISLLFGVSCTFSKSAGHHCIAAGADGTQNSAAAAAASWNGKTWSLMHVPAPGKGNSSIFEGVSCLTATHCLAAGEAGPTTASSGSPVAGFWNGTVWKVIAA